MTNDSINSTVGSFVVRNFKTIFACVVFVTGFYYQHQASMQKIEQLQRDMESVRSQVDLYYAKLDNVKLDKAVFEATMRQFADMSADIRQIRDLIEQRHAADNARK